MPDITPNHTPALETLGDPLAGVAANDPDSISALDAHFGQLAGNKGVEEPIPGLTILPKKEVAPPTDKTDKPVDKADKPADSPVGKTDKPAGGEPKKEELAKAPEPAKDIYSDVQLPANARGASAQAFATLKQRAAVDLASRDQKVTELTAQLTQAQEQLKTGVPAKDAEALKKELDDLRRWRATVDLEADPSWKAKFEPRLKAANEFIYSKLRGRISEASIKKIQELGGPDSIEWGLVFEHLADPQLQRMIQGKLDEVETVKFEKEQAVKDAKSNLDGYLANRAKEFEGATTQHNEATKGVLSELLTQVKWMAPPAPLTGSASEDDKTKHAEHTEFLGEVNKTLAEALADDSPQMRAVLLMGVAAQLQLKRVHASTVAENEGLTKKLADTEKALAEAKTLIERFKGASTTRLRESSAPIDSKVLDSPGNQFSQSASDALETFRAARQA